MYGAPEPDDHARRAASFGAVAGEYALGRPEYPPDAVRFALGPLALEVLDLAAGTGKLAGAVAAAGHRVIAVEPLDELRHELQRSVPGVPVLAGVAEAIPLEPRSVDAVVVGSAFHWFEPERAPAEIARVLRPGGRLALFGNRLDADQPWFGTYRAIVHSDRRRSRRRAAPGPPFALEREAEFPFSRSIDLPTLQALAVSYSTIAVREPPERAAVQERIAELWRDELGDPDHVTLRHRTSVRCFGMS